MTPPTPIHQAARGKQTNLPSFSPFWQAISIYKIAIPTVSSAAGTAQRFPTKRTTTNFVDEGHAVEALTAFNRLYMDHCWTTGSLESDVTLSIIECRSAFGILMPFTAREVIEPLQTELNCTQLFGMHCRGPVRHYILTVNHLQLMHDDVYIECTWKSLYTEDSLPKMTSQKRSR